MARRVLREAGDGPVGGRAEAGGMPLLEQAFNDYMAVNPQTDRALPISTIATYSAISPTGACVPLDAIGRRDVRGPFQQPHPESTVGRRPTCRYRLLAVRSIADALRRSRGPAQPGRACGAPAAASIIPRRRRNDLRSGASGTAVAGRKASRRGPSLPVARDAFQVRAVYRNMRLTRGVAAPVGAAWT